MNIQEQNDHEQFHLKLFKTIPSNQNLIFSPSSVYTTLSMAALGSEGNTLEEFKKVLGFQTKEQLIYQLKENTKLLSQIPEFSVGNKLYHNLKDIQQQFLDMMSLHFKSSIEYSDFQAHLEECVDSINTWVSEQTKGMIKQIVNAKDISDRTRLVLINAIYFKDEWKFKFKEGDTKKEKFYLTKGSVLTKDAPYKMVDMMFQKTNYMYYEDDNFQYVNIPYKNDNVKMEIILPKINMQNLEQQLSSDIIKKARSEAHYAEVKLHLPRFKVEDKESRSLIENLSDIGLKDCFNDTTANFGSISKPEKLFIYEIFHKAIIEVNEKGTKAAAVTEGFTMLMCAAVEKHEVTFQCNKPFIFLISNTTNNQCYFMGRVIDPEILEEEPSQISQFFKNIFSKFC